AGGTVTIGTEGVTTLTYYATDVAGNAEAPHTLVLRIDSTPPEFETLPIVLNVDATSLTGATVIFEARASDNSGLAPTIVCTPASGSLLPIGQTRVACVATDAAGNSATSDFTVTVAARTVTPSPGAHGSITPATPSTVVPGTTASFTVVADTERYAASVGRSRGRTLSGNHVHP